MLEGFRDAFRGPHEAIIVVPQGVDAPHGAFIADHPYPTERCVHAAQTVASFVEAVRSGALPQDGFVVLLSGGHQRCSRGRCPRSALRTTRRRPGNFSA
jgi:glycerate-2-kinase